MLTYYLIVNYSPNIFLYLPYSSLSSPPCLKHFRLNFGFFTALYGFGFFTAEHDYFRSSRMKIGYTSFKIRLLFHTSLHFKLSRHFVVFFLVLDDLLVNSRCLPYTGSPVSQSSVPVQCASPARQYAGPVPSRPRSLE